MATTGPPGPPKGPPYPPNTWTSGGKPELKVDVPITAVFIVLFIFGAIAHMTFFQLNLRRGHKYLMSAFTFGFCMSRLMTCTLRIAATSVPTNIPLQIAANIFVSAGIVLLYIINIILAQRIIRASHPRFGWHPLFSLFLKSVYVLIGFALVILITVTVQSFYTLRPRTRTIDRDLQLFGTTFMMIVAFLPALMTSIALLAPMKASPERFGTGSFAAKVWILLIGSLSLSLGAGFRCGTAWKKPVPRNQPLPWYYHKACFYIFIFTVELVVVYTYAIARVDLRFWVPNGAEGPGSYEAGVKASDEVDLEEVGADVHNGESEIEQNMEIHDKVDSGPLSPRLKESREPLVAEDE